MNTKVKIACKSFVNPLRYAIKIINFDKKKMILLTNEEYESYLNQINCHKKR